VTLPTPLDPRARWRGHRAAAAPPLLLPVPLPLACHPSVHDTNEWVIEGKDATGATLGRRRWPPASVAGELSGLACHLRAGAQDLDLDFCEALGESAGSLSVALHQGQGFDLHPGALHGDAPTAAHSWDLLSCGSESAKEAAGCIPKGGLRVAVLQALQEGSDALTAAWTERSIGGSGADAGVTASASASVPASGAVDFTRGGTGDLAVKKRIGVQWQLLHGDMNEHNVLVVPRGDAHDWGVE